MTIRRHQRVVTICIIMLGMIAALVVLSSSSAPSFANRYFLADVATGQLYRVDSQRVRVALPAADPDSGIRRLVIVQEDENHRWRVPPRQVSLLTTLAELADPRVIDLQSGRLLAPSSRIRDYKHPSRTGS